jgi:hypothetical protein
MNFCANCLNKNPGFKCGGCYKTFYCNEDCQLSDWENHKCAFMQDSVIIGNMFSPTRSNSFESYETANLKENLNGLKKDCKKNNYDFCNKIQKIINNLPKTNKEKVHGDLNDMKLWLFQIIIEQKLFKYSDYYIAILNFTYNNYSKQDLKQDIKNFIKYLKEKYTANRNITEISTKIEKLIFSENRTEISENLNNLIIKLPIDDWYNWNHDVLVNFTQRI